MPRTAAILAAQDARPAAGQVRGRSAAAAADYIGVSVTKFLEMVADGRMPPPKTIDRRRVWDTRDLDQAFDDLPYDGGYDEAPSPLPSKPVPVL